MSHYVFSFAFVLSLFEPFATLSSRIEISEPVVLHLRTFDHVFTGKLLFLPLSRTRVMGSCGNPFECCALIG